MEEKKNMSVEFYRVEDGCAALVEVVYVDNDYQERRGLLRLDTGSCENVLYGKMKAHVGKDTEPGAGMKTVLGFGGRTETMQSVRLPFTMGGQVFDESFVMTSQDLDDEAVGELEIIGLVGNQFLQRYGLVVNYETHTLHTSNIVPQDFVIEACDYFYLMHVGLEHYGVPVVGIQSADEQFACVVDTGATDSIVTMEALKKHGLSYVMEEGGMDLYDIMGGASDARKAQVEFDLIGLSSRKQSSLYKHRDSFCVLERDALLAGGREEVPSVKMLFGSAFLDREGWVLDFGAKAMYKRRRVKN